MPDSIREEAAQFGEWEDLAQKKFQRRAGFYFTKIDTCLANDRKRLEKHSRRLGCMEKFKDRLKTIFKWTGIFLGSAVSLGTLYLTMRAIFNG